LCPSATVIKTDQPIREYCLKRIEQLSINSLGEIPWLDEPTDEQKEWFIHKIEGSGRIWEVWDQK